MKRVLWVIGLIVAAGLIVAGLALAQGPNPPAKTKPAPAPAAPAKKQAAKPVDNMERFWNMKLERLQAEKQHLQDQVAAQEKKAAATKAGKAATEVESDLQKDLKAAQDKYDAAIKEIKKKYEDVDLKIKGNAKGERLEMRDARIKWLKQHPEVAKQRDNLQNEIRALKAKLGLNTPKPKPKTAPPAPPKAKP